MAVRQQQRRGTAAQWTSANPILSPGEIGFEIDTNKFKIGDGTTRWASLIYFTADAASALEDLIDGAPGLLDTLNELAAAVGDDANFFSTVTTNIATAKSEAISTAAADATTKANAAKTAAEATASADATTKANNAKSGAESTAATALSNHASDTTNIHGIADTSLLVTQSDLSSAISGATVDQSSLAGVGLDWNAVSEAFDIDSTVATKTYADGKASDAQSAAISAAASDATSKANFAQNAASLDATTKANAAQSGAETTAATALSAHEVDTTGIHGIADTAELATKAFAASLLTNATKTNITISGDKNGLTITAENGVADSTTDNLAQGTTNKYFSDGLAITAIQNAMNNNTFEAMIDGGGV
jgi:hypothetical protein